MTRNPKPPSDSPASPPRRAVAGSTWRERAFVLAGFVVATFHATASLAFDAGLEALGPPWLAALVWTVPASLACALRRGIRHGDWSAFRNEEAPDGRKDRMEWSTRTGAYTYMRVREEHERLMRGD